MFRPLLFIFFALKTIAQDATEAPTEECKPPFPNVVYDNFLDFVGPYTSKQTAMDASGSESVNEADSNAFLYNWTLVAWPENDLVRLSGSSSLGDVYTHSVGLGSKSIISFSAGMQLEDLAEYVVSLEIDDGYGCPSVSEMTIAVQCFSIIRADPGQPMNVYLDSAETGGRVFLRNGGSTWQSQFQDLVEDHGIWYEWVFVEYPDILVEIPITEDDIELTNARNDTENIYGPFTNPDGDWMPLPYAFEDGNYGPYSQNPSLLSNAASFIPPTVGFYKLKLVIWDGCHYGTSIDVVQEPGDQIHLEIRAFCTATLTASAEMYFENLTMDGDNYAYTFNPNDTISLTGEFETSDVLVTPDINYWRIKSAPEFSRCDHNLPIETVNNTCVDLFDDYTSVLTDFYPDISGEWVIQWTVTNFICGSGSVDIVVVVEGHPYIPPSPPTPDPTPTPISPSPAESGVLFLSSRRTCLPIILTALFYLLL